MESSSGSFESKKRKICNDNGENEEEDDEEEKMEKFYALINNIREARDRFISNNTKKRKLEGEKHVVAVWKPSFQHQDFMEKADDDQLKKPTTMSGFTATSQTKQETGNYDVKDEGVKVKQGLDLTLSL
ncbi:hypothetical protein ERO13_D08G142200v2 [Gossypium hirsutum]|uniref:Uncharacterized protein n=1 Tax=Gossypium tomentosum TaxID=34277 RepID=A0A5D2JV62_GOSTO|nr:hypothetical protein ERO13_D08G142200v2 [Gossypium hirsutum]TYH58494.1 hypothetical protein ES332_D08G158100v1 [Gossypium tomentosum]